MTLTPTIRVVGIRTIGINIAKTCARAALCVIEQPTCVGGLRAVYELQAQRR